MTRDAVAVRVFAATVAVLSAVAAAVAVVVAFVAATVAVGVAAPAAVVIVVVGVLATVIVVVGVLATVIMVVVVFPTVVVMVVVVFVAAVIVVVLVFVPIGTSATGLGSVKCRASFDGFVCRLTVATGTDSRSGLLVFAAPSVVRKPDLRATGADDHPCFVVYAGLLVFATGRATERRIISPGPDRHPRLIAFTGC
ncbi:hypothetical protein [Mycolicibacterium sp. GF69]|uniref:hypothetical protein n=1 Tax=Mycolicibacterium sp. GF69 TaxID=2267251 RepID=UPI001401BD54|nr:hypothetical protein [Mycolicibacterium sp. GF69]